MFSIFLDFPACIFLAFAYDRSLLSFRIFRALHALFLAVRAHTRRVQPKKHKKASSRHKTALCAKKHTMRMTPFRSQPFLFGSAGSGTRRHAHRLQISAFPFRSSLLLFHSAFGPFRAILPRFFRVHCVSIPRLACILPISSRIWPAFYPFFNFPETFETREIPKKNNVAAERDEFPRALYSMPPTGGILASQSESKKIKRKDFIKKQQKRLTAQRIMNIIIYAVLRGFLFPLSPFERRY